MYAITSASYRAITSLDEVAPGETAVGELPEWLISEAVATEVRARRDASLRACDWTQMTDAPLTAEQRAAWSTYRQALRDLPTQAGFPDVSWPTPPDTAA